MDFPLKNIWMTNWAINYFLQKTDWVCDKFRFFNKFEWVSYDIPLSKSIDWPCNGFPFWKQLTDCAMDFFFETTECLCDEIPFRNIWLTVRWNSFCKQPTSCVIYIFFKGWLCNGIPFLKQLNACVMEFHFKTTDWLCNGISFVNSQLTVWWNSFLNSWLLVWWNCI